MRERESGELNWFIVGMRLLGLLMGVLVALSVIPRVRPGILGSIMLGVIAAYHLIASLLNVFLKRDSARTVLIALDVLIGALSTYFSGFSFLLNSVFVPLLEGISYFNLRAVYYVLAGTLVVQGAVLIPTLVTLLKALTDVGPTFIGANLLSQALAGSAIFMVSLILQRDRAKFQEEREKFKSQKEFLQEMISKLEEEREKLLNTIIELKKQLDDQQLSAKLEMEKLQREADEYMKAFMKEKEELESKLKEREEVIKELEAQLEELSSELERLKEKLEETESFLEIALDLFSSLILEETMNNIINVLSKVVPVDNLVVFLREPYRSTYRYIVAAAYGPEANYYIDLSLPEGDNLLSYVLNERTPIVIESTSIRTLDGKLLSPIHPKERSAMALPLIFKDKAIGVLYLSSKESGRYRWDQVEPIWKIIRFITAALYLSRVFTTTIEQGVQDPQTGLYNHIFFYEQVKKELFRAKRYGDSFSIALIRLENYSYLRELIPESDYQALMKELGERLIDAVRESDVVARLDEDSFGLLLIKTSKKTGALVLNRVLSSIMTTTFLGKYKLTCKGALASFPEDGEDLDTLFSKLLESLEGKVQEETTEAVSDASSLQSSPSGWLDLNF